MTTLMFNTSCGLIVCYMSDDGNIFKYDDPIFLKDKPITSANVINGDDVFLTYGDTFDVLVSNDLECDDELTDE